MKRSALFPIEYDEISLVDEGAAGSADVLIAKAASGRSVSNPCSTKTNATGAKTGKSSTRAKNWKEGKHARKKNGQMAPTSAKSKKANGNGGTTKSKLDAACRTKKSPTKLGAVPGANKVTPTLSTLTVKKSRRGTVTSPVSKSALSSWDTDAQVRAVLERKPNDR